MLYIVKIKVTHPTVFVRGNGEHTSPCRRSGLIGILSFSEWRFEITVVTAAHFCMPGHSLCRMSETVAGFLPLGFSFNIITQRHLLCVNDNMVDSSTRPVEDTSR